MIKRRYAFMAFDAFRIFLTIIVGFTKGLVRFVLVMVNTIITLAVTPHGCTILRSPSSALYS